MRARCAWRSGPISAARRRSLAWRPRFALDRAAQLESAEAGCFPLVPYSNRLGLRRFRWKGRDYTTAANFEGSAHSLHGVGWMRPWEIESSSTVDVVLACRHDGDADWPFPYEARQYFNLSPSTLSVQMVFTNRAEIAQPVGLGWHPYFHRRQRSRLHIDLSDRWDSDVTQLPIRKVAQPGIDSDVVHLGFDNCFEGWRGPARIRDEKFSLQLTSSLAYLVVFTPQEPTTLRRAGQPRQQRDPHGGAGQPRPAQPGAGRVDGRGDEARGRGRLDPSAGAAQSGASRRSRAPKTPHRRVRGLARCGESIGGWSSDSSVSSNVPQCMPIDCFAFRSRWICTASCGSTCCGFMNHGLVGADRQQRDVEAAAARRCPGAPRSACGCRRSLRVRGVACEEDMEVRRKHRVAAPQRRHPVGQAAPGPMLHRGQHHLDRADGVRLPPVEFDDALDAALCEQRLQSERHDEDRRAARLRRQRLHAGVVEMVIVVVRDDDRVDMRQVGERDAGSTWRFGPRKVTGDARCEKIGSVSTVAPPAWTSIVAWPTHVTTRYHREASRGVAAQEREVGGHHRCRRPRRLGRLSRSASARHCSSAPSDFGSKST